MGTFVKINETYDLSTKVNKMGMLGIHTPSMDVISRAWAGLVENHRKIKIHKCDTVLACASVQSSDPLQVGLDADQIAPQDLFNPILYTAVSNDSFGTLLSRLYTLGYFSGQTTDSVNMDQDPLPDDVDNFGIYYTLLSDDNFAKAMPQSGLSMTGLRPLVHGIASVNGFIPGKGASTYSRLGAVDTWYKSEDGDEVNTTVYQDFIKGPTIPMPAIPTMQYSATGITGQTDRYPSTLQCAPTEIPQCFVGCIITPPAKQNVLYYRMKVSWTIEFTEPRPLSEVKTLGANQWDGNNRFYHTDYAEQSKLMSSIHNTIDAKDVSAVQIM